MPSRMTWQSEHTRHNIFNVVASAGTYIMCIKPTKLQSVTQITFLHPNVCVLLAVSLLVLWIAHPLSVTGIDP